MKTTLRTKIYVDDLYRQNFREEIPHNISFFIDRVRYEDKTLIMIREREKIINNLEKEIDKIDKNDSDKIQNYRDIIKIIKKTKNY